MGDGRATVFVSFHRTGEAPAFAAFADRVGADAAAAAGFVGWQLSVLTSPLLEWAIAVTFRDEQTLHDYRTQAPHARRSHPSDEHLLPLYFARGAGGDFKVEHSGFTLGALGMDIYRFG